MSRTQRKNAHLIEVKLSLASKFDRMSVLTSSKPKRTTLKTRADRYRRQAAEMQRLLDAPQTP